MKVYVIHGPNMNMLGIREPDIYGRQTYDDLVEYIRARCEENGMEPEFFQSNHEGTLVDIIQQAYYEKVDAIIINPAAYTHTSIAIHDALKAVGIPTVEVHLSNISAREEFRENSYITPACVKTYIGFGFEGYEKAVKHLKKHGTVTKAEIAALVDGITVGPFWSRHKVRVQDGKKVAGQVIDFLLDQQYIEPAGGGSYRLKK